MRCGAPVPVVGALAGASQPGPVPCGHLSGQQQPALTRQRTPTSTSPPQVRREEGGGPTTTISTTCNSFYFPGWAEPGLKPVDSGQSFQNTNPFGTSPSTTTLGQVFSGQFLSCSVKSWHGLTLPCFPDNNNDLFAAAPKPFISDKPGEEE